MNEQGFVNRKWRHSELIVFKRPKPDFPDIDCLLLAVDFEQGLFKLDPIDTELYEDKSFWCRYEYCERPIPKLRIKK